MVVVIVVGGGRDSQIWIPGRNFEFLDLAADFLDRVRRLGAMRSGRVLNSPASPMPAHSEFPYGVSKRKTMFFVHAYDCWLARAAPLSLVDRSRWNLLLNPVCKETRMKLRTALTRRDFLGHASTGAMAAAGATFGAGLLGIPDRCAQLPDLGIGADLGESAISRR